MTAIVQTLEDRTLLSAPVAYDQSETTVHDQPLFGTVFADDFDGDPLTYFEASGPSNGTLQFGSDGQFTFTPNSLFTGGDSFTWYAIAGGETSNVATVSIDVTNQAPVAYDQSETTVHDQPLFSMVYADDLDGDPLTFYLDAAPGNGTLDFNPDGTFTYTVNASFTGGDSFSWHASDSIADSNVATVTIDVTNNAPVAYDQSVSTPHDQPLFSSVYADDMDGDALTFSLAFGPANGALTFNSDGSYSYTPNAGWTGSDGFTWWASDGIANSNVAAVNIDVTNSTPVAYDQSETTVHDQPLFSMVYADDFDGDPLVFYVDAGPANGTLYNASGSPLSPNDAFDSGFQYVPAGGFVGGDSFTWHASDLIDNSNLATVTIDVTNNAPTAYDQSESTPGGQPLFSAVYADDLDGDPLTYSLAFGPSHGALDFQPDGTFTYTSDQGFSGSDGFTWWASDGIDNSNLGTVTINVMNSPPVAIDDVYEVLPETIFDTRAEGAPSVLANDSDSNGDVLTAILETPPTAGTLESFDADGHFVYVAGSTGTTDTFTYRAFDGLANSFVATVTLKVKPKVEILDSTKSKTSELKVAKWQNGYDTSTPPKVKSNFVDLDPDRFFVRVTDPSKKGAGKVTIKVSTDSPKVPFGSSDTEYDDDATEIELTETGAATGIFESKSQMLMGDDVDDDYKVDGIADDAKNDRTHKIALGGKVIAAYTVGTDTYKGTADVGVKKTLTIPHIYILKDDKGNAATSKSAVQGEVKWANERYAQAGVLIKVTTIDVTASPTGVNLKDGLDEYTTSTLTAEEKALFTALGTTSKKDIIVFYVNTLSHGSHAESTPESYFTGAADKHVNNTVIAANHSNHNSVAFSHELLHVLINSDKHTNLRYNLLYQPQQESDIDDSDVEKMRRLSPTQTSKIVGSNFVK